MNPINLEFDSHAVVACALLLVGADVSASDGGREINKGPGRPIDARTTFTRRHNGVEVPIGRVLGRVALLAGVLPGAWHATTRPRRRASASVEECDRHSSLALFSRAPRASGRGAAFEIRRRRRRRKENAEAWRVSIVSFVGFLAIACLRAAPFRRLPDNRERERESENERERCCEVARNKRLSAMKLFVGQFANNIQI